VKLCFINGICSLIADQVNALVFRRIKYITNNKSLWLRSILSTLVSQFFFTILWISFFKIENLFNINTYIFIFSNFQIKILFSIILLPFLYLLTLSLNRKIKF
ncbi:VUT family protein, partial [Vibrio parahaemolyticus]|nr:VUT family protein [Vibrio parahaemolyticus]